MKKLLMLCMLGLAPMSALAHTDPYGHGLVSGMLHPLVGMDHFLAMFGIGIMAKALEGRKLWSLPLGFLVMMGCGAVLAKLGLTMAYVEPMIAASVMLVGIALVCLHSLPVLAKVATILVALFAVFHGYVHVAEMHVHAHFSQYFVGILAGSAIIQLMGMASLALLNRFNMSRKGQQVLGQVALLFSGLFLFA